MPKKDGTGPGGKGPKKTNRGVPTPRKDGTRRGGGANKRVQRGRGK